MTAHCPLCKSNPMRRIILFALVLCLTVTPCHALTLFQTDYDGDGYTEERVAYQAPSSGPVGHLPPEGEGIFTSSA